MEILAGLIFAVIGLAILIVPFILPLVGWANIRSLRQQLRALESKVDEQRIELDIVTSELQRTKAAAAPGAKTTPPPPQEVAPPPVPAPEPVPAEVLLPEAATAAPEPLPDPERELAPQPEPERELAPQAEPELVPVAAYVDERPAAIADPSEPPPPPLPPPPPPERRPAAPTPAARVA